MVLSTFQKGQHVDDGDLIRLRDGECPLSEERILRDHLENCATCRENSERIEWLADGFVAAVSEIQPPQSVPLPRHELGRRTAPPQRRQFMTPWRQRRSARVAVVIAAVLALAMTTAPARALVAAGWQAVKTLFVGAPAVEPQQATSLVSFVPQGEEFLT